jgi:mono/diheme cytochrome c family protein
MPFFCISTAITHAAEPTHPIVAGFERFHAGGKGDVAVGGRLLWSELGCASCHQPSTATASKKQAPVLDGLGMRVRASYIKKFLSDPHGTKPGTTMPSLLAGDPDREKKVEALVHFLATTGSLAQEAADTKGIKAGFDLYHQVGCVACHGTRDAKGNASKTTSSSIPLVSLKDKYSITSLALFLENPHQTRPSGRMPGLLLGTKDAKKEAKDIANFLLQGLKVTLPPGSLGTTKYAYYEGSFEKVPDFTKLKPNAVGESKAFDLGIARRGTNFAVRFEGLLKINQPAKYRFLVTSDDGGVLLVDGKKVVNNDGIHPPKEAQGDIKLDKGVHKVELGFMQAGGGAELAVHIEGPGFGRQPLGNLVVADEQALAAPKNPQPKSEDAFEIQPALVEEGRSLFGSVGCANCHSLKEGKQAIASSLKAPPQAKMNATGGCLSETAVKGVPAFGLTAGQRQALSLAVQNPVAPSEDAKSVVARVLTTFNCYACHVRDKHGGIEDALDAHFLTKQKEMGEEARVPPPLDGVSAKMTTDYLKNILNEGSHDRPYMITRMPRFGLGNVSELLPALAALDKPLPTVQVTHTKLANQVKAAGRQMIGSQGFGCIKCHTFGGAQAEGVQGIDMTLMTQRLKPEWFHAYLIDPQKIRPGTRMPTAWPNGKSTLPTVLEGSAPAQIDAIWQFLTDGKNANVPLGVKPESKPLTPFFTAIIYRNFIAGVGGAKDSGARAIAVGYPEKLHLAFDANQMRLALLWQGAFIDAGRHWTGRGAGYEPPLGDNILPLPTGPTFALLGSAADNWPTQSPKELGYRFKGYKLDKEDRPTFLYALNELAIEEFPNPTTAANPTMRRAFTLKSDAAVNNLYFRAAVANKIAAQTDGWYLIDDQWKIRLEGAAGQIRQREKKMELLVPLRVEPGKELKFVQEIAW